MATSINIKHTISLGIGLSAFWWLLSGSPQPLLLALGVASALLVLFIALRMEIIDDESHPVDLSPRLVAYWAWLLVEIVKSSLNVTRLILQREPKLSLTRVIVPTTRQSDLARATFANSITLTPGTVTLDILGDELDVLALTREGAEGLLSGEMDRRVPDRVGRV